MQVFDAGKISKLDKMFMCGNYGDPAAGKYTLDIYRQFRKINNDIVLGMNTNGALQNTAWWHELGNMFNQPRDYVVFSIDGLEDTNHVYRKNVSWSKLMQNAASYISAGGSAHWDMLVYQHNEHQVDQCKQLARDMGFSWFRTKVSKRPLVNGLKLPIDFFTNKIESTDIDCHALKEKSAYIDAQGRMSPCCWLGSRQIDFVTDFEQIQQTWQGQHPNSVCSATCGTKLGSTNFTNQWQQQIQF